jgi:hypothetical protein
LTGAARPDANNPEDHLKAFFSIAAALLVLLGVGYLFLPDAMLAKWDVTTDSTGLYVSRRYGAMAFGYATILVLARSAGPSLARAAIMGGGAFVSLLLTLLSLWGILAGKIGPFAWSAVAIEGILAVTFGYCFLAERRLVMANHGG